MELLDTVETQELLALYYQQKLEQLKEEKMTLQDVAKAPLPTVLGLGGVGAAALLTGAAAIAAPLPACLLFATILASARFRR
ncbi:MAG: hypothetical protein F6J86_20760 [Symploca sp. SIO1B1]|nr:hypothetical protein [Symploca sp. SIO1B1]